MPDEIWLRVDGLAWSVADLRVIEMLNDWPDGTPKSFGNVFTAHWHSAPLDWVGRA